MHPALLLAVYCTLCVVASLSGGWVPLVVHLTHRRMQIAISFVSGVVLGIGLLHLVPHSFAFLRSIDATVAWVLGGFLFMFFLERFFHFHHHDAPNDRASLDESLAIGDEAADASHDHSQHSHGQHAHGHQHAVQLSQFSWSGAAIGLTLHGLVDGLTMAAAVRAEDANSMAGWAGLGAFMAVFLHKPFDALTIGTLLAASGRSTGQRQLVNALYALVTPLGVVLFYAAADRFSDPGAGLGQVLGFAAGAFICIASSDLLPELQFHRHDRTTLSLALIAGIALAWSTVFLEGSGHDHHHQPEMDAAPHEHHDHD